MSYLIELVPEARAEIKALPGFDRANALELIAALGTNPRPLRSQQLHPEPIIYRIWLASRWRIAYAVDDLNQTVKILRIRRKERIAFETLTSSWVHEARPEAEYGAVQ